MEIKYFLFLLKGITWNMIEMKNCHSGQLNTCHMKTFVYATCINHTQHKTKTKTTLFFRTA